MFKHTFLHAAQACEKLLLPEKLLVTDPYLVIEAAAETSWQLQKILGDRDILVRLAQCDTWDDWDEQWHPQKNWIVMEEKAKENRGGYAVSLYHRDTLCGLSLNSFALRNRTIRNGTDISNVETVDTIAEYVEARNRRTPLSGYVFACMAQAWQTIAEMQDSDRLVLSHVISPAVEKYSPILGFREDPYAADLDVYLDIRGGERLNWPKFLEHKQRRSECSPQQLFT